MNTTLEIGSPEAQTDFCQENNTQLHPKISEPVLSETERDTWIWIFEKLKNADLGLTFTDKVKFFCEASTPQQVEEMIQQRMEEQVIIPLAA